MTSRTARLAGLALALASASLAARPAPAQETAPAAAKNAVYVELFGNGILYSVNYDRLLTPKVAGRVGLMFVGVSDEEESGSLAIVPVTASYLFGKAGSSHHFEAGLGLAGATAEFDSEELVDVDEASDTSVYGTGVLGYRYQRPDGGFVFRAGLTPIFTTQSFLPWFGVSFGYGF